MNKKNIILLITEWLVSILIFSLIIISQYSYTRLEEQDITTTTVVVSDVKRSRNGFEIYSNNDAKYRLTYILYSKDNSASLSKGDTIKISTDSNNHIVELMIDSNQLFDLEYTKSTYKNHISTSFIVLSIVAIAVPLFISAIALVYKKYNKKERNGFTKKQYRVYFSIVISVFVIAFASLIVGAVLQNLGYPDSVFLPFAVSFFPIAIIDLIFLLFLLPRAISWELSNHYQKQEKVKREVFKISDFSRIETEFKKYKLMDDKFYHKKEFSLYKDYYNFYFSIIEKDKSVEEAFYEICDEMEEKFYKKKHKCFIVLVKGNIENHDFDFQMKTAHAFSTNNMIQLDPVAILCLYNINNNKAYLMPSVSKLSAYNKCYRKIKKILQSSQIN